MIISDWFQICLNSSEKKTVESLFWKHKKIINSPNEARKCNVQNLNFSVFIGRRTPKAVIVSASSTPITNSQDLLAQCSTRPLWPKYKLQGIELRENLGLDFIWKSYQIKIYISILNIINLKEKNNLILIIFQKISKTSDCGFDPNAVGKWNFKWGNLYNSKLATSFCKYLYIVQIIITINLTPSNQNSNMPFLRNEFSKILRTYLWWFMIGLRNSN